MKKFLIVSIVFVLLTVAFGASITEARGRVGSFRVGGYTSHGKGSHYYGGYVRSYKTYK